MQSKFLALFLVVGFLFGLVSLMPLSVKADADTSLFWYGVGSDWRLYHCTPDNPAGTPLNLSQLLQGWQSDLTTYTSRYEFNSVRLAFSFEDSGGNHTHNVLNTTELDAVLELLSNNHIKAVLDLHDWVDKARNWSEMQGFFGSQAWINDWVAVAAKYKDDPRVLAYEVFNEPSHDLGYWDPSITGGGGDYEYMGVGKSVQMALAECVDAIRSTGDNHPIVYPDPRYWNDNYTAQKHPEWFFNSANYRPNIVVTFHDWFENPTQQTDTQFQTWWNERVKLQILWKAYVPIWIGEFGVSLSAQNQTTQTEISTTIINWALDNSVGFNIFVARSNPPAREQQWSMTEPVFTGFPHVPTITSLAVDPALFSPGLRTATVNGSFDVPTGWTLQVVTTTDDVSRTWQGSSQTLTVVWDGKNNTGYVVPDETYSIRLDSDKDLFGIAFATDEVEATVDTSAPNITITTQNPLQDNVSSQDEVKVKATITDSISGIKRVILNCTFTNGSETWNQIVSMQNLGGSIWNATIPAFPYGTNVTYSVVAEDNAGNIVNSENLGIKYQYQVVSEELASLLVLPSLMIATILEVAIYRKKTRAHKARKNLWPLE